MKRISFILTFVLFISSCGNDNDDDVTHVDWNLMGTTFYRTENYTGTNHFTFGNAEYVRMLNALNYLPTTLYEKSWERKDTILTLSYSETKKLTLSFTSKTNASFVESMTTVATQQRAEKNHNHYYFPEDYYNETSSYMVHITANTFDHYDKRTGVRTAYRLNNNRCCNIDYFYKNGGTEQLTYTDSKEYNFTYDYNSMEERFFFNDGKGHSANGYVTKAYSDGTESIVFNLYTDSGIYTMSATDTTF